MNPLLRLLFIGGRDRNSIMYSVPDEIIRQLWQYILYNVRGIQIGCITNLCCVPLARVSKWPEPKGICINMLPFIMSDEKTIPEEYRQYWPLVQSCPMSSKDRQGRIGYLTIHESSVPAGETQRRRGIHTESAGFMTTPGRVDHTTQYLCWGGPGNTNDNPTGGIYMASNTDMSCAIWNYHLPQNLVGPGGDVEHLRPFFSENEKLWMRKDEIWWLTDRTPHEALPRKQPSERQFFRLVTSEVAVWWSDHSTHNPMVKSDARVISGDKFEILAEQGVAV